jgi:hypothetical protein
MQPAPRDSDPPEPADRAVFAARCPVPAQASQRVFWWGLVLPLLSLALLRVSGLAQVGTVPYLVTFAAFCIVRRAGGRVIIGDDGITFVWWRARTFLAFAEVVTWRAGGTGGRDRDVGSHAYSYISLANADRNRWRLVILSDDMRCVCIADAIGVRLGAWRAHALPAAAFVADGPYRQLGETRQSLMEIVSNPRSTGDERLRALAALPRDLEFDVRARLWSVARATANPVLRLAFGKAYWASEPETDAGGPASSTR